jgi:hypothetical protein
MEVSGQLHSPLHLGKTTTDTRWVSHGVGPDTFRESNSWAIQLVTHRCTSDPGKR